MGPNRSLTLDPLTSSEPLAVLLPDPLPDFDHPGEQRPTVVFRSECAGEGDQELGRRLAGEILQALRDHPEAPQALLFYNSGVRMAIGGSPSLDILAQLQVRGSEILVCRSSLTVWTTDGEPAVGKSASMAELVDRMRQARVLLWP
jgi:hypothetical protein